MRYRGHVIRPPSEAKSYLLQITYGCSWNKCTFCPAYLDKPFKIRPIDEIEQGTLLYKDFEAKKFILPDEKGLLKEMRAIIENIETERTIFRTNHASNYLPLEGILSRDKRKLVEIIDQALKGKILLKPEFFRGL